MPATATPARSPQAPTPRCGRGSIRYVASSYWRCRMPAVSRHRVEQRRRVRDTPRRGQGRPAGDRGSRQPARGRRTRCCVRRRTCAGSAVAVPAAATRRFHAGPADCRRSGERRRVRRDRDTGARRYAIVVSRISAITTSTRTASAATVRPVRASSRSTPTRRPTTPAARSLRGLLQTARARGWHARTLDLRNSGDTSGTTRGWSAWRLCLLLNRRPCWPAHSARR